MKVIPSSSHKGSKTIEPIVRTPEETYFMYQKRKYVWDEDKHLFVKVDYPTTASYQEYLESKGLITSEVLASSERRYGRNIFDIPMPSFWDLYKEQALAPFFVFQVFCVALWCLDDYFYYSLFILFMLLVFEATTAKSRLNNVQIFRGMAVPETSLLVYRSKKWAKMSSTELLPGDIALLRRTEEEQVVPCDFLLLTGHCITNEAMLTGESTPQMKEPISSKSILDLKSGSLDIARDKLHVIFGGTKILQHSNPDAENGQLSDVLASLSAERESEVGKNSSFNATSQTSFSSALSNIDSSLNIPDGCLCYVLRTGFQTSQGKLVRTILYSSERVTENNRESFLFIFILLLFALAASGYVLYQGLQDEARSRWKLMLSCTLIITSVVPPELPMQLSLAVTTSLLNLTREGVFCTEPFRIPYAGKVDFAAFDKTGTLTQEHLNMKGVVLINDAIMSQLPKLEDRMHLDKNAKSKKQKADKNGDIQASDNISSSHEGESIGAADDEALDSVAYVKSEQLPDFTSYVMAGCHSLSVLDREVIGDPIESAALKYAGWTLMKSDTSKKGRLTVTIRHRFHFNSALKRMSVVANIDHDTVALVKGAPETLMNFLEIVPENYERVYKTFARRGARIIAMAYKTMKVSSNDAIRSLKREEVECDLTFAGFLVFECPLKPDSKDVIVQLQESSHTTVMITGDAALTACEVARRLEMVEKPLLILEQGRQWTSVDESVTIPYDYKKVKDLANQWDLCLAGSALSEILAESAIDNSKGDALTLARVFARASPDDKTGILAYAKKQGKTTLMCGDGTNDVGALKQAHVGIALLVNATNDPRLKKLAGGMHAGPSGNGNSSSATGSSSNASNASNSASSTSSNAQGGARGGRNAKKTGLSAIIAASAASGMNANNSRGSQAPPQSFREAMTQAQQLLAEADEESKKIVQLGDASVAAPFTSKGSSIKPLLSILRQGRCTLVTTMQMFKILALNSLIYAYSLSVLYMDGIKFGDTQATIMALLSATCFLFISRSQPLAKLSKERPTSRLFSPYMVCSVVGQFLIHLAALMFVHQTSRDPSAKIDTEATFAPSLVNSVIFLLSASQQLSTFAVNYQGHPFMQSIRENKGLFICLLATFGIAFSCVLQISTDFNQAFDLVILPDPVYINLAGIMTVDFVGAYLWEMLCKAVLK